MSQPVPTISVNVARTHTEIIHTVKVLIDPIHSEKNRPGIQDGAFRPTSKVLVDPVTDSGNDVPDLSGGNRMPSEVKNWFETLSAHQKGPLNELRQLIQSSSRNINEALIWSQPCYSIKHLLCYLQKSANHVTIGFQQGSHLDDPEKLLVGDGKNMRHIKIVPEQSINRSAIRNLITSAIEFDENQNP